MPPNIDPDDIENEFSEEEIPAKRPESVKMEASEKTPQSSDEENSEDGEDEYVVEKILSHKQKKADYVYHVKWQGYEDDADMTWEPEDNLSNAKDVVERYWKALGGRDGAPTKGKKRKVSLAANDTPNSSNGTRKKKVKEEEVAMPKKRTFPAGSWEHDVATVETLEQINDKEGKIKTTVFLLWSGIAEPLRTAHDLEHIRKKCPQKLIDFFISRLVFKETEAQMTGDGEMA